jgi:hypothetical protein
LNEILIAAGHPGDANNVLPVARYLREIGQEVVLVATEPTAADIFIREKSFFRMYWSAATVMKEIPDPSAVLTGMGSFQVLGDLIADYRDGEIRTVTLLDPGDGGMAKEWIDIRYEPGIVCVNDQDAKERIMRSLIVPEPFVVVTGSPAFDRYVGYEAEEVSVEVRKKLGMTEDWPVVLYAGQLEGTSAYLYKVISALNTLEYVYFMVRKHPRMETDGKLEILPWQTAMMSIDKTRVTIIDTSSYQDIQPLIAAADVVVAQNSTVLVEAALLRKAAIAQDNNFWLARCKCAIVAPRSDDLYEALRACFDGKLLIRRIQERHLIIDGKSAERVGGVVLAGQ